MKILLVLDETSFFHPSFANNLVKKLKEKEIEIFGGLVTQIPKKNSIEYFIIKKFYKLYFSEIFLLSIKKILLKFLSIIFPNGFNDKFYSVRSVFNKYKISYFDINGNINTNFYLKKISSLKIDLIISSNSLYFGKEILQIPKLGSINRHTSLLPSYGGVWPVLQAISHNEKDIGVTVHKMTSNIDEGDILAQKIISVENNKNLTFIYKKAFQESSDLVIKAIDNLLNNKKLSSKSYLKSYFSFPNDKEWTNFRKNGGRFI